MNRIIKMIIPVLLVLVSVRCHNDSTVMMPNVTGAINEVLLILNNSKWDDTVGHTYLDILAQEQLALNQSEPIFDVLRMPHAGFNNIFHKHRSVVINNTDPKYTEPKIIIQHDVWAKTQIVINVYAPDDLSAVELLMKNKDMIVDQLNVAERNRIMELNRKNPERGIYSQLMEKHKLGIFAPSGYKMDVDTTDFIWLSLESPAILQGVFIYHYDFDALKPLTPEFLIAQRNKFTRKYVPGNLSGSYMTTEMFIPPVYSEILYKDRQFYELRGLWTLENGFMGGPFISFTTVDQENKRIVTAEGYVFAPNKDKKNYIRQLEAIVYSLVIPEDLKEE